MSEPPSARDEPGDLKDLPDWVKGLGLPAEAAAAIDRWWKPVWDTIADQLALLPAHPRPAPAAGGERIAFEAVEELEPGAKWQARFEAMWPAYRAWYLREGEAARPGPRRGPAGARAPHAGAGAGLRAAGGARGRRRARRPAADALPPAGLHRRLLAGRLDARRRAGAGAQLRLPGRAARGDRLPHRVDRPARARDERLPVGPARRHQRRRPGDLAHLRRPRGRRRRLRRSRSSSATCWRRATRSDEARAALARIPVHAPQNLTVLDRAGAFLTAFVGPERPPSSAPSRPRRTTRAASSGRSTPARSAPSSASSACSRCSPTRT